MHRSLLRACTGGILAAALSCPAAAENAPFDLAGPTLRIAVTHAGTTLPLGEVPALAAGDRIRIETPPPVDRGSRLTVLLAFLRGASSPPPREWLIEAQPWIPARAVIDAVVPEGAEQAAVLLVPDTGGAAKAVGSALRGRPGSFVRAVQELNQATLDRARLDAYLAAIRSPAAADTADAAARLARNLAVKIDPACLVRQPEVQAACLAQGGGAVLPDAQTSSLAQTLAGTPADVALQFSATPQAGFGYYSPYIGLVRDLARIFGAFQSAQLQFIPALEVPDGAATRLLLNSPPSFRRPQSVLVAPLPTVGAAAPPPLVAATAAAVCATRATVLLPVSGAPLVYATDFGRDMALRVTTADGGTVDVPARADAFQGGYVVDTAGHAAALRDATEGRLHGLWGFAPFDGPRFRLVAAAPDAWHVADRASLVVGRDSPLPLEGGAASCVDGVSVEVNDEARPVDWTVAGDRALSLKVPLAGVEPGTLALTVRSDGLAQPQRLAIKAFAEPSRLASFTLHAGDREGTLVGSRLDQVATLDLDGAIWRPATLGRTRSTDRLAMVADAAPDLHAGDVRQAKVTLADGRTVTLKVTVAPAGPPAVLVARSVERVGSAPRVAIALADAAVVPQDARLVFSLRAQGGIHLAAGDQVEVATADGTASTVLPLVLQDSTVAVASFVPADALGAGALGPVRFRLVKDGTTGSWQPLATVVRLPAIAGVSCAAAAARCTLSGDRLFLLRRVSADSAGSRKGVDVPDGFTGSTLSVPRPTDGRLYLKLRDAPMAVASIAVPS